MEHGRLIERNKAACEYCISAQFHTIDSETYSTSTLFELPPDSKVKGSKEKKPSRQNKHHNNRSRMGRERVRFTTSAKKYEGDHKFTTICLI
jgi:hypothetical protein